MSVRLIATDEELVIVFRVLLSEYRERVRVGKAVVFLPWKFVLPEEEITVKDKKKFLVKKTGEQTVNFSFESEDTNIGAKESLRMLGVTLYHLVTGKSELTHESFLLDGYRRPINSSLWSIIQILLLKEETDTDRIEEMIEAIDPAEMKTIDPPDAAVSSGSGKTKPVDDTLRWLASEGVKVIDHAGAANFWSMPVPQNISIRYSEETLQEAIAANRNGEQWALAYYCGLSLRQMRDKVGTDRNRQPCYYNNNWWLQGSEDSWATKNLEPGYYLLNFHDQFAGNKWADQESLITVLGPVYERAHETVVSETVISNFGVHNGERLMENWYHWGKEAVSGGSRVFVGGFDSDGWGVDISSPDDSSDYLRVVVFRKFDF